MTRKPLNLVEKWSALKRAANCNDRRLNATAHVVLFRLLDHQNTKTGQCNPSVARMARDIGVSRRTVNYALTQLEERGLIRRVGRVGQSNQYAVLRASETELAVQRIAGRAASGSAEAMQRIAAKKEKEKLKEKGKAAETNERHVYSVPSPTARQIAEKKVVAAIERMGSSYEDLISVPTCTLIDLFQSVAQGQLSSNKAAAEILDLLGTRQD
ncbi:helix-turn-helix domain-containing protein [Sulfitobacter mediterraneus]|uniref:helix-turn-helix domain-containing protein n=1 Tax=Sulfitobacter mediterraneus TaxID=83219 RepID=UPI00056438F2|nr:helix-turn-helix domain-containing protein [Sulfitobacter mediterraneus]